MSRELVFKRLRRVSKNSVQLLELNYRPFATTRPPKQASFIKCRAYGFENV